MTPNRRRWWVNWTLVISAIASVGAVLLTRNEWTSGERVARSTHLVVGFRNSEIRGIRILSGDQELVLSRTEFQSKNGSLQDDQEQEFDVDHVDHRETMARWQFVEPYQGEAEEATVDALLRAIEFAPFIRKVDDATFDRKAAGLDAPVQTIELDMATARTRIHVGGKAPAPQKSRYVEVGGEGTANKGVYVVSDTTADDLLVSLEEFRVRQLVPYGSTSLGAVTLRGATGKTVTLEKGAQQDWRVVSDGRSRRVEEAAMQRFFAALTRSRAERFLNEVPPVGPLGPGDVEATFVPKARDKAPLTLRFGGPCPGDPALSLALRATEPPLAVCTVPLHLDTFTQQLPELVERRLFGFEVDAVEEVRVQSGERVLELARREEGWMMRRPQAGNVERDVGAAFVEGLLKLRGEIVGGPPEASTALATVTVVKPHLDGAPTPPESVEVFTSSGFSASPNAATAGASDLFVHRLADDVWLRVGGNGRRYFEPSAILLKATLLLEADVAQISTVRIQTPEWTQAFEYLGHEIGCRMTTPAGYTADGALCLDVVDELRALRAKTWVAEADDGSFGLGVPTLRAVFGLKAGPGGDAQGASSGGPRELALTVGRRSPDNDYYAQLSSDSAVFTLRESTVEVLSSLVLDRSPFLIDPEQVQSLTVSRFSPSRVEVTFRRLGNELVPVNDPLPLDQRREVLEDKQTALVDALSLLRPEGAVALLASGKAGQAPRTYGFDAPLLEVKVVTREDGATRAFSWIVGSGDVYRNVAVYYALPITLEPSAVFIVPREAIQRILDAL